MESLAEMFAARIEEMRRKDEQFMQELHTMLHDLHEILDDMNIDENSL